jgi:hypothetical protein
MNPLNSSQIISHVDVKLKTSILSICSVSTIRLDVLHIDRQITLMLKVEQISETLVFNSTLTWLVTQAGFNAVKFINLNTMLLVSLPVTFIVVVRD